MLAIRQTIDFPALDCQLYDRGLISGSRPILIDGQVGAAVQWRQLLRPGEKPAENGWPGGVFVTDRGCLLIAGARELGVNIRTGDVFELKRPVPSAPIQP